MFSCSECKKTFTQKQSLNRHKRESCAYRLKRKAESELCETPSKTIKLDRNVTPIPKVLIVRCNECNNWYFKNKHSAHLRSNFHKSEVLKKNNDNVKIISSAFKNRIVTYMLLPSKNIVDIDEFFNEVKPKFLNLITEQIEKHKSVKINIELFGQYFLQTKETLETKSFNTKNKIITSTSNLNVIFSEFLSVVKEKASIFAENGSGWALSKILYLELNVNKHNPIKASSYIPLPKEIVLKHAVINVKNNDSYCFGWSVISALFPTNHNSDRTSSYPNFHNHLNFEGIEFPIKLRDIKKFEELNQISINVYGLESIFENNKLEYEVVGPLHYTFQKQERHVNLLLITDGKNNHFCWIKDMSRLVSSQINNKCNKKYFCDGCLIYFYSQEKLDIHQQNDCNHMCTKIPTLDLKINKFGKTIPENILQFENFQKQLKVPFVIYADFECFLKPVEHEKPENNLESYTVNTFKHEPYAFAYFIKCAYDDSLSVMDYYFGENSPEEFCKRIEGHAHRIYNDHLKNIVPMKPLSAEEKVSFRDSKICQICSEEFKPGDVKVRDHDHQTGNFRFAAHSVCNLNFQNPNFIPIFFHNLNYDQHLYIKHLCNKNSKIDVIAQSKEKYISFTKTILVDKKECKDKKIKNIYLKLRFLDSFRFVGSSLEKISETLDPKQCIEIKKYFSDTAQFNEIRKKGIYPYSYVNSIDKLYETQLPAIENFYDELRGENLNQSDYERATNVWSLFKCQNLMDYTKIYLLSDVLILTDFFEAFRNVSLNIYNLDPTHYITAPSLSWDSMLKKSKIKLELLTDIDMINFFKKSIRGGICHCSVRKAEANNQFIPNFNPLKENSYIMYLDATNLYGHSMSQYLPVGDFSWLTDHEINNLDVMSIPHDSEYGYVVEIDIIYPTKLHDKHNEFPFLADNICPPGSKQKKLICNLEHKQNYVIHYQTLQQALKNGLLLKKIHRAIKFKQSPFLKPYIDLNTEMRNKSKNKLEKDCYKLFNNSIYGKSLENVDKRVDIKLVTHWQNIGKKQGAETLISRPNFKNSLVFTENLVAIQMERLKVTYNKPVYIGFTVLELSKTVIYGFYYDYIKNKYGDNAILLYTDTDSLVLYVKTNNFYTDIQQNLDRFDTSNYDENNVYKITKNKSVLGRMKDEFAGKPIVSFYGTGAKAYCVNLENNSEKKAKGVKKYVIQNSISQNDYKDVIENNITLFRKMNIFKSILHDIYTQLKNKVALSPKDDKRYIIPGLFRTLARGHRDIKDLEESEHEDEEINDVCKTLKKLICDKYKI